MLAYVCIYVTLYVRCTHPCVHLWRLEAHVVYLSLSLSFLVVETAFLTELGGHSLS